MIKEVKTKKNVVMVNKNHEKGYESKKGEIGRAHVWTPVTP